MVGMPKTCIFCGGAGLSKEHIWPNWMRSYIPRQNHNRIGGHKLVTFPDPYKADNPQFRPGRLARPGDMASKRVRCVCETCNNGWMSGLQTENKPLLTQLLAGTWPANGFAIQALEQLSSWMTMFTMIVEFADPESSFIASEDHHRFFRDRTPDQRWRIYVGRYQDIKNQRGFWHRAISVGDDPDLMKNPNGAITQAAFGQLFFLTIYLQTATDYEPAPWFDLRKIWPTPGKFQPPNFVVNDYAYDRIMKYTTENI